MLTRYRRIQQWKSKDKVEYTFLMGAHRQSTIVRFVASIEWPWEASDPPAHELCTHEWD
jgi:hypothetical protein